MKEKKRIRISIHPVEDRPGNYLATFRSEFLDATFTVFFKDTITGALALHSFAEMIFPALRAGATLPQRGASGCSDPQARLLFRQTRLCANLNPLGGLLLSAPPSCTKKPRVRAGLFCALADPRVHDVPEGSTGAVPAV